MHSIEKRDNLHIQDFDIVGNDLNVQKSTIKFFFLSFWYATVAMFKLFPHGLCGVYHLVIPSSKCHLQS